MTFFVLDSFFVFVELAVNDQHCSISKGKPYICFGKACSKIVYRKKYTMYKNFRAAKNKVFLFILEYPLQYFLLFPNGHCILILFPCN